MLLPCIWKQRTKRSRAGARSHKQRKIHVVMQLIRTWFERHFADPQVVGLALVLLSGFIIIMWLGEMLAPVIASMIIAYLLAAPVDFLERKRSPRLIAVVLVFVAFMTFSLAVIFGVLPLLFQQAKALFAQLPIMISKGQDALLRLPEQYPNLFSEEQVFELIAAIRAEAANLGQRVVSVSLSSVVGALTVLVYVILMPLMVFFFLKDKRRIQTWASNFLPEKRGLSTEVWREVNLQIGNYVRGKVIEILIVWLVTYVTFTFLDLNFAILLSALVGLSVLIPYVGAVVVTVPVALIAYFQWGFTGEFAWLVSAYLVIQFLDGNLLVPLLFSEVVNLHPVAIIVAVLVFGGLWGFWGVFFAIPLATLVQAVIKAWPDVPVHREPADSEPDEESPEREETALQE